MIHVRRLIWEGQNAAHILRHGVTAREVEEVCHADHAVRQGYGGRLLIVGPTAGDRLLVVILAPKGRGGLLPGDELPRQRAAKADLPARERGCRGMTSRKRKEAIPEFASYKEEAAFWDTHDTADYWDDFKPVKVRFAKNLSAGITIRFDEETLFKLRAQAKGKGIGPTTLARMWILERLKDTSSAPSRRRSRGAH